MFSRRDMERNPRRKAGMVALALLLTLAALAASGGPPAMAQGRRPPAGRPESTSTCLPTILWAAT